MGDVLALVKRAVDEFSSLDLAFNNADVTGDVSPFAEQSTVSIDVTFAVTVEASAIVSEPFSESY